ncbi:MAG: sulfate adenylyltransferase subunit CysD [Porticoccaceae bacterium]|jgi:sulfate adenylyltransferase subunit 2|nr:sulfate adenylyltransferase subunit CysD [Porticoccaceae bacterium]
MSQKHFESQHAADLLAGGSDKIWRLEDVKRLLEHRGEGLVKRTLERRISAMSWLNSSHQPNEQMDELNRPATQLVLDALVIGARKKRKAALFVQLHRLPTADGAQQPKEPNILVAEDGKGAKRWCLLSDDEIPSLLAGLTLLAAGKPTMFFPSGNLVVTCRELKRGEQSAGIGIDIATGQFPETFTANIDDLSTTKATGRVQPTKLSHLDRLEAESLYIIREVMAHAENPVMLYSVGKDSAVMLHLARKAFYPSPPPFPLMHVDTRWKFQAMYDFRDIMAKESKMELIVHTNPEGIERNINPFDHGSALHTDIMKTQGLKQALDLHGFDVAFGGARRDEEKSRAKERIFSFRNNSHRWDPKNQRPELWNLYNCRKSPGESVRVFPLSNWTELDIWQYIYRESIPIVPLYYAAERPVVERNGMLIMVDDDRFNLLPGETIELKKVRFRTLGCYPLTGAVESSATDLSQIVLELLQSRTSEREGRAIDSDSNASMEKKKQEGYF